MVLFINPIFLIYRNSSSWVRSDIGVIVGLYNPTAYRELCNSITLNNSTISGYPKSSLPHYICLYCRALLFTYRVICMSQADINPYGTSRCPAGWLAGCLTMPELQMEVWDIAQACVPVSLYSSCLRRNTIHYKLMLRSS
jgi:hypothetical protein